MIESSYPPGSIRRYVSTQVLPAAKEKTPKVVGGVVAVVALTVIGHFSLKFTLGSLKADGLGEKICVAFIECLWGIFSVGVVIMAIATVILIPVGCRMWFLDWKEKQLAALNGPTSDSAAVQIPLTSAEQQAPGSVAV